MRSPGITGDAHEACPSVIALHPLAKPHNASLSAGIAAAIGEIAALFSTGVVSKRIFHVSKLD